MIAGGPDRVGENVRVYDPVRGGDVVAEIVPPCFVDPKGERSKSEQLASILKASELGLAPVLNSALFPRRAARRQWRATRRDPGAGRRPRSFQH